MPHPRLVFVHIPKSGGTTLNALLDEHFHADRILPKRYFNQNALFVRDNDFDARADDLARFDLVHEHFGMDILRRHFPGARFLSVLREPGERVVSLYNDWRTKSDENRLDAPPEARELIDIARTHTLGGFLRCGHPLVERQFRDAQARQLVSGLWRDAPPDPARAIAELDRLDVVGTTDLLAPTVLLLCRRMGWNPPANLARLNRSRGSTTWDTLDPETRELVRSMTRADQAVYAHARDRLARELAQALSENPAPTPASTTDAEIPAAELPADGVVMDASGPVAGEGWHVREGEGPYWRWTGPQRWATIALPALPASGSRLVVRVISVIADDILQGTLLLLDGHPLPWTNAGVHDGQIELHAELPPARHGGACVLTIVVPRTMSHAEIQPETGDHRQKGLAITRVLVEGKRPSEP